MSRYQLTEAQRQEWERRMKNRIRRNDTVLARKMNLDSLKDRGGEDYDKTVAGYVGEFRRGQRRGLIFFFDNPERLDKLALACSCTTEELRSDLSVIQRTDRIDDDMMWLAGFEDLGPIHIDDGFVLPPVEGPDGRLDREGLKKLLFKKTSKGMCIRRDAGAGVTTLIRWLARQAAYAGWHPARWEGQLPQGRSIVLIADPDDGIAGISRARTDGKNCLSSWLDGGQILIRASRDGLRTGPVDTAWLNEFIGKVKLKTPPQLRWKWPGEDDLKRIAALQLGPEDAGVQLRCLMERSGDLLRSLEQAARRRLQAYGSEASGLVAFGSWFPDLVLAVLRDPTAAPLPLIEGTAVVQARRTLDQARLTSAELALFRACLPALSGEAALSALRSAGLLAESDGHTRIRLTGMIAKVIADRLRDDPVALKKCLSDRQHVLLDAVADTQGGGGALVATLERLDAPALRRALKDKGREWLRRLPWSERLTARVLVSAEIDGSGDAIRRELRRVKGCLRGEAAEHLNRKPELKEQWERRRRKDDSPLTDLLSNVCPPSLEIMAEEWSCVAAEFGVASPPPDRAHLLHVRALHLARPEDVAVPEAWSALGGAKSLPARWLKLAREHVEVAKALLNPDLTWNTQTTARVGKADRTSTHERYGELVPDDLLIDAPVQAEIVVWLSMRARQEWERLLTTQDPEYAGINRWEALTAYLRPLSLLPTGRGLTPKLCQAAQVWSDVATTGTVPRPLFSMGTTIEGLVAMLRALEAAERRTWLRTPDGRIGIFWREAVTAGVPDDALIALWQDTAAGALHWPLSPYPGYDRETPHNLLRPFLLEQIDNVTLLQDIGVLPETRADFTKETIKLLLSSPKKRRWIWSNAEDLGEDKLFWHLLDDREYTSAHFELASFQINENDSIRRIKDRTSKAEEYLKSSRRSRYKNIDEPYITALLQHRAFATLPPLRWEALVRAGLLAKLPPAKLWCALDAARLSELPASYPDTDSESLWAPIHTLVLLLTILEKADHQRLRDWMLSAFPKAPRLLDSREVAGVWSVCGLSEVQLEGLLATREGGHIGDGLLPALLRLKPAALRLLMEDTRTREAALYALSADHDLRAHLPEALANAEILPPPEMLHRLLTSADIDIFSILDEISVDWPLPQRRTLWQRIAGVSQGDDRAEAWHRLALLQE